MIRASLPPDEAARMSVLAACQVLDTPPEWRFDDLVELAARLADTPVALVSLIDADRQWFKARIGLDATETPRDISFCGHAVLNRSRLVVPDATLDHRFADNPLVTGFPNVRFYAGQPIEVDGQVLGTLCVIDTVPRTISPEQLENLAILARQAASQLELRRGMQRLEEQIAARGRAEAEAERFLRLSVDLLCIISMEGAFLRANPAWETFLGHGEADLIGRPLWELLHPDDRAETVAEMSLLRDQGHSTSSFENRMRALDGSWRWLRWSAVADLSRGRIYATARDFTDDRDLQELKSQFVSTVSHELRTPLTSIRGALGLVTAGALGELPGPVAELLQIASRNSERLVWPVNDILDVEELASQQLDVALDPLDLCSAARDAIAGNQAYAQQHGVHFVVDLPADPVLIAGAPDRIRQVLDNLLSNAAKFSPEGAEVALRLRVDAGDVLVEVEDHGLGIPVEFHSRVFERFAQADGSDSRARGGSGLGLNISQSIVHQHGGEIGFASTPGQGSTFWFRVPLAGHRPLAEPLSSPAEFSVQVSGKRSILVCEDDHDVAGLVRRMLEARGFDVGLVHTAAQARAALSQRPWDVMTLDLGLPDQEGLSLLQELRTEGLTMPVVVLTGSSDGRLPDAESEELGVHYWMSKPIDESHLVQCVRAASRGAGGARVLYVEDDDGLREVVTGVLANTAEVTGAATLAEATRLLETQEFDALILDLGLPDGDGAQLLDRLPDLDPGLPVVLFTGRQPARTLLDRVQSSLVKTQHSERELVDIVERLVGPPTSSGS